MCAATEEAVAGLKDPQHGQILREMSAEDQNEMAHISAKEGEEFQSLQNDWLAKSDFERANGAEFELYDEAFHLGDPGAIIYIYVPIKTSE